MNGPAMVSSDGPERPPQTGAPPLRLVLVTGVAGAGKTSALAALADHGFDTVDNPPLSLIGPILDAYAGEAGGAKVAIGVDARSRGFSPSAFADAVSLVRAREGLDAALLWLECSDETLLRRFDETRRRHPLARSGSVAQALELERAVLGPLREQADASIDTSDLSLTDLRREVAQRFGQDRDARLAVGLVSFGFKRGAPREADLMFDLRFLRNPYWEPALRDGTGLDAEVAAYVAEDPDWEPALAAIEATLATLLPLHAREGRSYLTIAVGCTGGRHRSVAAVERLAGKVRSLGFEPTVHHRDLHAAGPSRPAPFSMQA